MRLSIHMEKMGLSIFQFVIVNIYLAKEIHLVFLSMLCLMICCIILYVHITTHFVKESINIMLHGLIIYVY